MATQKINNVLQKPLLLVSILLVFGPMLLGASYIYLVASNSALSNYRGYFSYWSATLGDAIFLTIAVYYIYEYLDRTGVASQDNEIINRIQISAAGVLSAIGTIYIHWLWQSNPETEFNWTYVGVFNIYGYLHGLYFFVISWCLLIGLQKLLIHANYSYFANFTARDAYITDFEYIFTAVQALMAYVVLLVVDNASGEWSSIISNGLFLLVFAIYIYYLLLYMTSQQSNSSNAVDKQYISRLIFLIITTAALIYYTFSLTKSAASLKDNYFQSFMYCLYIPMLCFQNYIYNLFRNHGSSVTPMFVMAGITIYISIASSCSNAFVSVQVADHKTIIEKVSVGVSDLVVGWVVVFLYGLLVTKNYEDKKDLTPESGYFNFLQNFAAFFVMAILLLLFTAAFANQSEIIALGNYVANAQSFRELIKYAIGGMWTLILLVVGFNFQHLTTIITKDRNVKPVKRVVSLHIWILMAGYTGYGLLLTMWCYYRMIFN